MSLHRRVRVLHVLVWIGAMLLLSCGGKSGPPPKKQVILSTEYHDQKAGAEAAEEISQQLGILPDSAPVLYAKAVGARVARFAPRSSFQYTFEVIDQAEPNAFALPGGYIYLSRGILALTNSEDELAAVIAHEITHAVERHAAGRQAYASRMNPFVMGYMRAAQIAAYGREHERDADRGAQRIAASAGYDPEAMATLLHSLDHTTRLQLGFSRLPSFFDTHPSTPERAATASQRAEKMVWERRSGIALDRAGHLRSLQGLIVADNPAEGVFIDNRFLHVDLDFTIRFPEGWNTQNTHAALVGEPRDGDAQAVLRVVGSGDDPSVAAKEFLEKQGEYLRVRVQREQEIKVGDYPGYRVEAETSGGGVSTSSQVTWLAYEGLIYQISVVARGGGVSKYLGRGRSTARSFRPLTSEERDSVLETRLAIVRAEAGETLGELSARTQNAWDIGKTAVLNDLDISEKLREGHLVKIATSRRYEGTPVERPSSQEIQEPAPGEAADAARKDG